MSAAANSKYEVQRAVPARDTRYDYCDKMSDETKIEKIKMKLRGELGERKELQTSSCGMQMYVALIT